MWCLVTARSVAELSSAGAISHPAVIGLFGGSFDPVHLGHLALARTALQSLSLDAVHWIPSGTPPHRTAAQASNHDRVAMLECALRNEPRFVINPLELEHNATSYTVDTLLRLRQQHWSTHALVWLIGADQFARLETWHRWQTLFELAHLCVVTRPGWDRQQLTPAVRSALSAREDVPNGTWRTHAAGAIVQLSMPPIDIASTQIRLHCAAGHSLNGLLPQGVLDYIEHAGLYRKGKATGHP